MCTYRVIHRLHHNNLYTDDDPDTAIHGGYPRGTAYLWKKLGQDLWSAGTPGRRSRLLLRRAGTERRHENARLGHSTTRRRSCAGRHASTAGSSSPSQCCAAAGVPGVRRLARPGAVRARSGCVPMLTVLQPILRLRAICEHGAVRRLRLAADGARSNRAERQRSPTWSAACAARSRTTSTITSSTISIRRCRTTTCRACIGCSPPEARSTAPRCATWRRHDLVFAPRRRGAFPWHERPDPASLPTRRSREGPILG